MYSYMGDKRKKKNFEILKNVTAFAMTMILATGITHVYAATEPKVEIVSRETIIKATSTPEVPKEPAYTSVFAKVTGYNTVPEQTDATPCIAAGGVNICGRGDVVACPREYALGTQVEIDGKKYTCLDRTHSRYNARFDISCDKDTKCPGRVTGAKWVKILK